MKTVSLELSKQLKEAGYPQEGVFIWSDGLKNVCYWSTADELGLVPLCFAPTADEILEQLPLFYDGDGKWRRGHLVIEKGIKGWTVGYINYDGGRFNKSADTLADAAAKMWLYLKKEKLI